MSLCLISLESSHTLCLPINKSVLSCTSSIVDGQGEARLIGIGYVE